MLLRLLVLGPLLFGFGVVGFWVAWLGGCRFLEALALGLGSGSGLWVWAIGLLMALGLLVETSAFKQYASKLTGYKGLAQKPLRRMRTKAGRGRRWRCAQTNVISGAGAGSDGS